MPEIESEGEPKRPANRYELLSCGWSGHVLVGLDAEMVEPHDAVVVVEHDGVRLHRCLRCDAWIPRPRPAQPARLHVPARDEIELPQRGPLLRDKYVLRLIALDRAVHVTVLLFVAVVLLLFVRHNDTITRYYETLMNDLNGGGQGSAQIRGVLGYLGRALHYPKARLVVIAIVALAYAALEATEMVGLWFARRWAEYLTFVATIALIPYEVYELTIKISVFKIAALVLNVAIAAYLLWAKRLFGVRGGHASEEARRQEEAGWSALERTTPPWTALVGASGEDSAGPP